MRLRDAAGAEYYMKQAREHGLGVGFVSVREREDVVDWLEPWKADSAPLCLCVLWGILLRLVFREAAVDNATWYYLPRTAGQSQHHGHGL